MGLTPFQNQPFSFISFNSRGGDIVTVLGLVRKTGISSVGIVAEPDGR